MDLIELSISAAERFAANSFTLPENSAVFSITTYLADILCNPDDNQHVVITISSRSGRGKSYIALAIAEELAKKIAEIKGGEPNHYFNPSHISVMDNKKTMRLIAERSQYEGQILVVDEGLENFSRKAMTKENIMSVQYNAIGREYRMCIIRNVQIRDLLDYGVLEQSTHEITISRAAHKYGYNEVKFKIKVDKDGARKSWAVYPTLADGFTKVTRCRVPAPSAELLSEYKKIKRQATNEFVASMFDAVIDDSEKKKREGVTKRDETDVACMMAWQFHLDNERLSMNKCTELANVGRETFSRWLRRNNKEKWYSTAKQK